MDCIDKYEAITRRALSLIRLRQAARQRQGCRGVSSIDPKEDAQGLVGGFGLQIASIDLGIQTLLICSLLAPHTTRELLGVQRSPGYDIRMMTVA